MRPSILDRLHKAVVASCFFTTIVGTAYMSLNAGYFIMYILPERRAVQERQDRELLEEGISRPMADSDNLPDIAPTLKG